MTETDRSDTHDAEGDAAQSAGRPAQGEVMEVVRFLAGAALVYLVITTLVFRVFYIPSESMQPTLEVHDRVMVTNFSYGYSRHTLPFGLGRFLPEGDADKRFLTWLPFAQPLPDRGDVVVFWKPKGPDSGEHLIKRVIGLPNDLIYVQNERLYINCAPSGSDCAPVERVEMREISYRTHDGPVVNVTMYQEELPEGPVHPIFERSPFEPLDDAGPYRVPAGHIFVMGDNRDSSRDSRLRRTRSEPGNLGFVPAEWLVGKAVTVLFTFKRCQNEEGLACPTGRVWRPL